MSLRAVKTLSDRKDVNGGDMQTLLDSLNIEHKKVLIRPKLVGPVVSRRRDRQTLQKLAFLVSQIRDLGSADGFSEPEIASLLDIIVDPHFGMNSYFRVRGALFRFYHAYSLSDSSFDTIQSQDPTLARALVESLYPKEQVSLTAVRKVLAFLGNPSLNIARCSLKAALLTWLTRVLVAITPADRKTLASKYYGVLFHYLAVPNLQRAICSLLCDLTEEYHVKPYRIRKLKQVWATARHEPTYLGPLIGTFHRFRPYLVDMLPDCPHMEVEISDVLWCALLKNIRDKWAAAKRVSPLILDDESMREDLRLLAEFHNHLHGKGERDDVVLEKHKLQSVYSLQQIQESAGRSLRAQLQSYDCISSAAEELKLCLECLLQTTKAAQTLSDAAHQSLLAYVEKWDGSANSEVVFELATYMPLFSHEVFSRRFFNPLVKLYKTSNVFWKASLIQMYIGLVIRWGHHEWPLHVGLAVEKENAEKKQRRLLEHLHLMFDLILQIDKLLLVGLVMERDSLCLQHAALRFWETVPSLLREFRVPVMPLPSAPLVYRLFFSGSAMAMSRICSVVADYKEAYAIVDVLNASEKEAFYNTDPTEVTQLNAYVTDMVDCIYLNKAFMNDSRFAKFFNISSEALDFILSLAERNRTDPQRLFSLAFSSTVALHANEYTRLCENVLGIDKPHFRPITPKLLMAKENPMMSYNEWRLYLLEYLRERGYTGIYYFLYTSVRSLTLRGLSNPY
ncbi:hypothetical protein SpCBS45565_g06782 [Spizellomyces sp. 'palustris']|nr:hypothetical protein SpCBS45565_g06782 [Spizellomyces sp. 'palustris']